MLHGDAAHTHRSAARGPKHARVLWRTSLGSGVATQVVTNADETTLYVGTLGGAGDAGARGGDLVALEATGPNMGKEKWRVPLEGRVYATPCVGEDGTVYAASDAKWLYAVSPAGKVVFKFETKEEADTSIACGKSVVVAAGRDVITLTPRGDVVSRVHVAGKVYSAPIVVSGDAAAGGDLVVFGSQAHRFYATRGNAIAWEVDIGADVDASPVAAEDGSFWIGTDKGEIVHVSAQGRVLTRTDVGGYVRGSLSLSRTGDVLAGTYGPSPRVVRVRPDGSLAEALAIHGTGSRDFGVHGSPLEDADGVLFFGAQDDAVYAVGHEGELLFRFLTKGDVDAPLTLLSNGTLIVASEDGTITALHDP